MKRFRKYFVPHHSNNFHPHFFRTTGVVITIVALTGIFFLSSKLLTSLPKIGSFAAVYSGMVIAYTNDNRQASGELAYVPNDLLTQAAQMKANDMAEKGYFAHNSPDGKAPWYWIEEAGYIHKYAGENLAIDFTDSKDVINAWMSSPTHRANILNSQLKEIGVATAVGMYQGRETTFVVQMFGTPANKPTPVAKVTPQLEVKPIVKEQTFTVVPNAIERRVEGAYTDSSSLMEQIVASPKKGVKSLYYIFMMLVAGLMFLGAVVEFKRHHKGIWSAGGILIVITIGLLTAVSHYWQGALI